MAKKRVKKAREKVKKLHEMSTVELLAEANRLMNRCEKSIILLDHDVSRLTAAFKTHVLLVKDRK